MAGPAAALPGVAFTAEQLMRWPRRATLGLTRLFAKSRASTQFHERSAGLPIVSDPPKFVPMER